MSEHDTPTDSAASGLPLGKSAEAPVKVTAGALLRAGREAQGLHIAALATAIKVTPRKVDALENDRWGELPDATFARALAQTICRHLKIDPQPVLALLPPSGTVALEPASRIQSTPYRDRAGRAEHGPGKSLGPLFWGAALLLVGAAAVYLMPVSWWGTEPTASSAPVPTTVVSTVPLVAPAASAAVAVTPPAASASAASAASTGAAAAAPALVAAGPATAGAETVFSAPPPSAGAAPAVKGALVVTTTDASWVEVRDAKGQTLLSETVQPGRSIGVDGPLPFRLLIGNASATQLVFRGRSVDVMARSRENVARFELQ